MTQLPSATINIVEMPKDMENYAIHCAQDGFLKLYTEKEVASHIKREFDKKYGPTWNCFVGRNFGSYVTHETNHYFYFYMGQMGVLLFKSS
ncbi:dynein light chain lc6, flagellar outer arm [Trypanosoma rangeli SC58]|uniref:Dynein light chain n=1 Tax=Trypanosoma rangeli SC58 TaxID=429131 RepID=A0A061IZN5_TRYRA|nr:dynein light chain lc6, flagellar outer arm [Trypanosoma rangeli SC58]